MKHLRGAIDTHKNSCSVFTWKIQYSDLDDKSIRSAKRAIEAVCLIVQNKYT